MKFNTTDSFHLSTNQAQRLEALLTTRGDKTPQNLLAQVVEMGLYQLEYRKRVNARNSDLKRLGRRTLEAVNSGKLNVADMRRIAVASGLAERNEDDDIVAND